MFRFGGTGNYPAGAFPWSATPKVVAPGYNFFTPASAPAAQELNYVFGGMSDASAAGVAAQGASWRGLSPVSTTGYTAWMSGAFDSNKNRWLVAAGVAAGTGACEVFASRGLGDLDYSVAVSDGSGIGIGGKITGVAFDGTKYFAAHVKQSDSSARVYSCSPGGAWAVSVNPSGLVYRDIQLYQLGGKVYALLGASDSLHTSILYSGDSGATWNGPYAFSVMPSNQGLLVADNGTTMVVMPVASAPSTYVTGSLGTWANRSGAFLATNTQIPYGLAFEPTLSMFVLVTSGSDNKVHTWQSQDGATWNEVGTPLASFNGAVRGLAVTAAGCLCLIADDGTANYTAYSVDGGVTWRWSQNTLAEPGFTALTYPRIYASPVGFWSMNSGTSRFSHTSGLGPILT